MNKNNESIKQKGGKMIEPHKQQATQVSQSDYVDLAPSILRQRLVIEGYPEKSITAHEIEEYLSELSNVCGMTTLLDPVTHCSDTYGWAGWIHWETSGAHFYAWDRPVLFFSVDIYTCKAFSPEDAVEFTQEFFQATSITSKGF